MTAYVSLYSYIDTYLLILSIGRDENSVILLDKKYKLVGTRIIGPASKYFKSTKYSRIISISSSLV